MDEHVPNALARGLTQRGIEVLTANEAGLLGKSDREVLAFARAEQRVVVTHDADFLRLSHDEPDHAGIAYCAHRSRTVGQMVESLTLIHELFRPDEMVGRVEYL